MAWWTTNRLRLIQNNLRESDANLDVDLLITQLKELSANVLMMNAGGIVAFYPTELEYHYRAAGQRKDLLQEAVEKAHANGMRFIARFDFSKAHESIFAKRPEWFYRTREGKEVNYHGIVHTCVNSFYQQEYSLQVIDEVLTRYEVDGIFFNMFGYQTRDYSGRHYGICFCESCQAGFREFSGGMELPETESLDDPVYRLYKEFQDVTVKQILDRIHELVKSKDREIAISTYNEYKVDIVRKESNTDIHRPHPVWLYSASENVQSLEDSWDDKLVSNCSINAIDLVHRFTGVSNHEINIRLKEGLASGSGLDFCIIGVFDDYPDRENLPTVADIFKYHKDNERYYGQFHSMADVALVKPGRPVQKHRKEYFGLYKMLKEEHILFDVIHQNTLAANAERLKGYRAILIPDTAGFSSEELKVLELAHEQGVSLLATGGAFTEGAEEQAFLRRIFYVSVEGAHHYHQEAAYLWTEDKQVFPRFPERDWIFLDGPFHRLQPEAGAVRQLPLVEPTTYGPPERAFGHRISEQAAGAQVAAKTKGRAIILPWQPGTLYYQHGFADHKHVVLDLLEQAAEGPWKLSTNAPPSVEVFFHRLDDGAYLLHLLNLSGFNGVTYFEPLPVYGIELSLRGLGDCQGAENLVTKSKVDYTNTDRAITIRLGELKDFAAIVIRT
ncbi:family 10 glycosylhydrolase [Paenibacillus silviterrae]|uniref:family 10 glycosylhydrolase n=1 Tax=Paenibacillus silviterrae TaxID=3242194 RepID=UPI0025432CCD|nr:family 10 glycosylhydrolase [Paenibacillus chinjuensis]